MKKGIVMLVGLAVIPLMFGCSKTGNKMNNNLNSNTTKEITHTSKPTDIVVNTELPVVSTNTEVVDVNIARPTDSTESAVLSFEDMKSAKSISECSIVKSTIPANAVDDSLVSDESDITIAFQVDMDETTLIPQNFMILEGKHNSIINDLFDFHYDAATKELHMYFKIKNAGGVGTGNSVGVYLTKSIKTSDGINLDSIYVFGYDTL